MNYYQVQFWTILIQCCFQLSSGLLYNYGDGSYYIGDMDGFGKPIGHGKFYNTSGALSNVSHIKYISITVFIVLCVKQVYC